MVAITGVSGSGKSTLVHDVLYNASCSNRRGPTLRPAPNTNSMEGDEQIAEVVLVDQSPMGRTPRSNPVTYIKAFDAIREVFAATPESQQARVYPGTFFLQHPRRTLRNLPGRWHGDDGDAVSRRRRPGVRRVPRPRFKSTILEIHYKGKNIYDVLQMTVKEALNFFSSVPKIRANFVCWKKWALAICVWGNRPRRFPVGKRSV